MGNILKVWAEINSFCFFQYLRGMSSGEKKEYYSVEEYLEREPFAEVRSEFFGGELFAMAGGRHRHNLIQSNCHFALRLRLQGKGSYSLVAVTLFSEHRGKSEFTVGSTNFSRSGL